MSPNSVKSKQELNRCSTSKLKHHVVEVAIHTILYVRQIYPADLFVRRKKYDTPVFQSRHPALNEYISGAVKAIGEELAKVTASRVPFQFRNEYIQGNVDKIVVVVKDKKEVMLERFIFAVQNMIEVETYNKDDRLLLIAFSP